MENSLESFSSMLQTLSDTDENLLDDLLMLKYGISRDGLTENQEAMNDPDVVNILERSYYSQAKGYFTGGMQNYAAEENNLTPSESLEESYRRQIKNLQSLILESMDNPDDESEYIDKVKDVVNDSEVEDDLDDEDVEGVQDDLIKQYYDNTDEDYVAPEVVDLYNSNSDAIEDLGVSDFLDSIEDLPDEQKEELANIVITNMPLDDKIDLAMDYLDNQDVSTLNDEVANIADAISDDRLSREDTGKAILSMVAEITDNPDEAQEIIDNLSDESIDLIGDYISSVYSSDNEMEGEDYDQSYEDNNDTVSYEDNDSSEDSEIPEESSEVEDSDSDSDFEYDESDSEYETDSDYEKE